MKLTALDIHHKEFGHALRGYNEEQVDSFLDQVADEFERLFKENIDLSERLEAADERVRGYQQIETSLNATLIQAQRSSEEIVSRATSEADSVLRDAELKAKEIIHNALQRKQTVANELIRIKQAEEEFRSRYKAMLEDKLRSVNEINLPDDVSVLARRDGCGCRGRCRGASVANGIRCCRPAASGVRARARAGPRTGSTTFDERAGDNRHASARPAGIRFRSERFAR